MKYYYGHRVNKFIYLMTLCSFEEISWIDKKFLTTMNAIITMT